MPEMTAVEMAKKKPGRPPRPSDSEGAGRKPMVAQLRGSEGWKAWIEKLARFENRAIASLIERAVERYAKEVGFPDEPPER
jgi:hypothetical protein